MMRPFLYALTFLAVIGLGAWAYSENYATQGALREVADLQDEIATLRDALATQNAEWAYLNRPERLRELATLNFDRLGLLPMEPSQFGDATQISMPPPPVAEDLFINNPQDVMGSLDISTVTPADPEGETTP
jgi:hypothetical protein